MEIEVKISNLSKEDIIYILSEVFKHPMWNKNNVVEVTNNLLDDGCTTIINSKNIKFRMSLNSLYRGIELFMKNGGGTNPCKYDLVDGDKIIQYSLFGTLMF